MPSETKIDVAKVVRGVSIQRENIVNTKGFFFKTGLEVLEKQETPATQTAITISEETKQQGLEACKRAIEKLEELSVDNQLTPEDIKQYTIAANVLTQITAKIYNGTLYFETANKNVIEECLISPMLEEDKNFQLSNNDEVNVCTRFIYTLLDEVDAIEIIKNNNTKSSNPPDLTAERNSNDALKSLKHINKLMSQTNVKEYNKTDNPYQPIALAFFIADTTNDAVESATDLHKFLSDIYRDDINKQKEWVDKLAKEAKASGVPEDKADQVSKFAKAKIDNPKLDFKKKASIFSRVAQAVARAPGAVVNFIGSGISMAGNVIKNTIMMPVKLISSLLPNTKTPEIENPQNDAANVTSVDDVTSERFHSARSSRNPTPELENDALKQQAKEAAQDMPASEKVSRNNQPEQTAANKQPTQIGR